MALPTAPADQNSGVHGHQQDAPFTAGSTARRRSSTHDEPGRAGGVAFTAAQVLDAGTIGLRYPTNGREITLPVVYVTSGKELVVLVGRSQAKTWWRHFLIRRPVEVWWHGAWRPTTARAFAADTPEHTVAASAYQMRHPHVRTAPDLVVLVTIPTFPRGS